jgi:hypothetical protein
MSQDWTEPSQYGHFFGIFNCLRILKQFLSKPGREKTFGKTEKTDGRSATEG